MWTAGHCDVLESAEQITAAFKETFPISPPHDTTAEGLGEDTLTVAYEELSERFDTLHGGFGEFPKFPTSHNLFFLLRYWKRTGSEKALKMVERTLIAMCLGGIYDHVGFGFHRYATDREWLVPHFEKMLYDQAMIALAYIEAFQATGNKVYEETVREIFTYVLRDMTSPEGGFYSAEDADSEGVEGKFYLWSHEELEEVLSPGEAELIIKLFNVQKEGNFVDSATGERPGTNILNLKRPVKEIAPELDTTEEELEARLEGARKKLFDCREKRVRPHKDDKVLTDWNGLMIAALAKGAEALGEPRYAEAAAKAAAFIFEKMRTGDKEARLLHRWREGESAVGGFLDDYAFFIWGLIELYEATFEVEYLKRALELNGVLIERFWDEKGGGFYFTSNDAEDILVRNKNVYDGAVPSGNSVAMGNLLRLGRISADSALEEKAAAIGRAFSTSVNQSPFAYTQLLCAVDFAAGPSYEVVIAGETDAKDTKAMLKALGAHFLPNKVVLLRPGEVESPEIIDIANFTKDQVCINGRATAYVCSNYSCKHPTTDKGKLLELLGAK
jgi:uncharacterized protein YyaL (SSP411 family)